MLNPYPFGWRLAACPCPGTYPKPVLPLLTQTCSKTREGLVIDGVSTVIPSPSRVLLPEKDYYASRCSLRQLFLLEPCGEYPRLRAMAHACCRDSARMPVLVCPPPCHRRRAGVRAAVRTREPRTGGTLVPLGLPDRRTGTAPSSVENRQRARNLPRKAVRGEPTAKSRRVHV